MELTDLEVVLLISVGVLIFVVKVGESRYLLLRDHYQHMFSMVVLLADRKATIVRGPDDTILIKRNQEQDNAQSIETRQG